MNPASSARILFLGDILGKPGRALVLSQLPVIRERFSLDLVLANGENSASDKGSGITAAIARELHAAGIPALTLGNHAWGQKEFIGEIDSVPFVCRPANFSASAPGASWVELPFCGKRLGIACLLGHEFMKIPIDSSPFRAAGELLERHPEIDAWIFDFHAETTAEKMAMGWYLNGRALAVVGTHTHVQTNDAQVLDGGTAYITDLGMCGPYRSIIGHKIEARLPSLLQNVPPRAEVASEDVQLRGCLIEVDPASLKARSAQAFRWPLPE
ncbi:MAG: YmdB family metallophosphoesterase [Puniceicoccales bacterium]|jgi:metallophosphoesterase (TIGR00282 family)|nr:YmdB family metallophosphoesterase [Puniceicoccales bacterium]